jgi:hypothetical protein
MVMIFKIPTSDIVYILINSYYLHIVALDGGSISLPWASTFCSNHDEIMATPSRGTAMVSVYNILLSLFPEDK